MRRKCGIKTNKWNVRDPRKRELRFYYINEVKEQPKLSSPNWKEMWVIHKYMQRNNIYVKWVFIDMDILHIIKMTL